MKITNIFYLCTLFTLILGFYSCNNDDEYENRNKIIDEKQKAEIRDQMLDTAVYYIDTNGRLGEFSENVFKNREQELVDKGFVRITPIDHLINNPITKASVQEYTYEINPMSTIKIDFSQFRAKFSQQMCNTINSYSTEKISSNKTYVCMWYRAHGFVKLAPNQKPGPLPSPEAALTPTVKYNYSERGYNGWTNGYNEFIHESHQLIILYEDVKGITTQLEIRYPKWTRENGYLHKYAILTL